MHMCIKCMYSCECTLCIPMITCTYSYFVACVSVIRDCARLWMT